VILAGGLDENSVSLPLLQTIDTKVSLGNLEFSDNAFEQESFSRQRVTSREV
jgi:hypothetical protein